MWSALFSLQEGKAEQPKIRREGKQIAHSSQNKLLLGGSKTAGANSTRHGSEGPEDRAGPGEPAPGRQGSSKQVVATCPHLTSADRLRPQMGASQLRHIWREILGEKEGSKQANNLRNLPSSPAEHLFCSRQPTYLCHVEKQLLGWVL